MRLLEKKIPGLCLLESEPVFDERGSFRRSFCRSTLAGFGIDFEVFQGNISENTRKYTLRGFHYQLPPYTEGKLLTCVTGSIYNVVVDLRPDSPAYMAHEAISLSSADRSSLIVPPGCANAFLTMDDSTTVHYYMSSDFDPERYAGFRYDDLGFSIDWPVQPSVISEKDLSYKPWSSH